MQDSHETNGVTPCFCQSDHIHSWAHSFIKCPDFRENLYSCSQKAIGTIQTKYFQVKVRTFKIAYFLNRTYFWINKHMTMLNISLSSMKKLNTGIYSNLSRWNQYCLQYMHACMHIHISSHIQLSSHLCWVAIAPSPTTHKITSFLKNNSL